MPTDIVAVTDYTQTLPLEVACTGLTVWRELSEPEPATGLAEFCNQLNLEVYFAKVIDPHDGSVQVQASLRDKDTKVTARYRTSPSRRGWRECISHSRSEGSAIRQLMYWLRTPPYGIKVQRTTYFGIKYWKRVKVPILDLRVLDHVP